MQLFHPQTRSSHQALLKMLTSSLRPDGSPFPIEEEYPLVLGHESSAFSYCLGEAAVPFAHASLWPRLLQVKGGSLLPIGLVGNVATDARHRGQGLMKSLLETLRQEATRRGLKALVLWSDLLEFYQKCGFTSCSQERRWRFRTADLPSRGEPWLSVGAELRPGEAEALLATRLPLPATLARSGSEFATLLTIPDVSCLRTKAWDAYTVMGKGCDMTGVVHEWGAASPKQLLAGLAAQAAAGNYSEILLLTPQMLPSAWDQALRGRAAHVESVPMALAWYRDSATQAQMQQCFIWGLDSI